METLRPFFRQPARDSYKRYINRSIKPPLDTNKLDMKLLEGEERRRLHTPTTGDSSLLLCYKNREGALTSLGISEADIEILQLQGAKQEGYRVLTSLYVVDLFADQIAQIVSIPESGVARVTMPPIIAVIGLADASEGAMKRYKELALKLGMKFSRQEERYIKDIR